MRSSSAASYTRRHSAPPLRSCCSFRTAYRTLVRYPSSLYAGWPPYPYRECLPSSYYRCRGCRILPSQPRSRSHGLCRLYLRNPLSHPTGRENVSLLRVRGSSSVDGPSHCGSLRVCCPIQPIRCCFHLSTVVSLRPWRERESGRRRAKVKRWWNDAK